MESADIIGSGSANASMFDVSGSPLLSRSFDDGTEVMASVLRSAAAAAATELALAAAKCCCFRLFRISLVVAAAAGADGDGEILLIVSAVGFVWPNISDRSVLVVGAAVIVIVVVAAAAAASIEGLEEDEPAERAEKTRDSPLVALLLLDPFKLVSSWAPIELLLLLELREAR